jgi:N utilization substance protein B
VTVARNAARHRSRRAALQALYASDLHARGERPPAPPEASLEALGEHFELAPGAREFAKELVAGVAAHRAMLDEKLVAVARNWRLERMAHVDRNLLRLAAFEILVLETPPAVAIDEAVQLAHEFGDDATPRFVNGVLDALAREAGKARGEGA